MFIQKQKLKRRNIFFLLFKVNRQSLSIIKKREFKVYKLRAVAFGGYNEDDRVICLKPTLPEKGALDILVMLSLAIADYIDKGCIVKIEDGAKIDNNYPLSWRKFFTKGETTYSKYDDCDI